MTPVHPVCRPFPGRGCLFLILILVLAGGMDLSAAGPQPALAAQPTLSGEGMASPPVRRPSRFSTEPDLTYRNQTLSEDAVWHGQVLIDGALIIAPQATVTVSPGTLVRFRSTSSGGGGGLIVHGRLVATGTEALPILFTSDTADPEPGDWEGLLFLGSAKKNLLEWCRIDQAVAGVDLRFSDLTLRRTTVSHCGTGISLHSSRAVISGGTVSGCGTGLALSLSDTDLEGAAITGNDRGVVLEGGSLYLAAGDLSRNRGPAVTGKGGRLRVERSSLSRNLSGLTCTDCRGELVQSRIEENRSHGLELTASPLRITGNTISGNGEAGVTIHSGGGALWDNNLAGNGGPDLVNKGEESVAAPENWWGTSDLTVVTGRLRTGCAPGPCGVIRLEPLRSAPPPSDGK